MCNFVYSLVYHRYCVEQKECYLSLFVNSCSKGIIDNYYLSQLKYFTQLVSCLDKITFEFNDLSFYIRARFFRCTDSSRYKFLDKIYWKYDLKKLNDILNSGDYRQLTDIKGSYAGIYFNRN